jgi:hypothetical protein
MPDIRGHLSPAEIRYILDWINKHHLGAPAPYPCPVSGHTDWIVDEYITQSIVFPIQANLFDSLAPKPWPMIRLVCTGCGYVMFLNAGLLELYPPPPTPPPPLPKPPTGGR